MHARIASLPRLPGFDDAAVQDERTRGVTGLVYKTVRGATHLVGGSTEALLGWLAPALAAADPLLPPRPEREAVVAALNGVLGDHLAATDNPLAVTMALRRSGRPLPLERFALRSTLSDATPKVLVLLHGLCMSDLQWQRAGHDPARRWHGTWAHAVYLHYNSGLSISTNGRILAQLMERLYDAADADPAPDHAGAQHGRLVARSAIHHGADAARRHALARTGGRSGLPGHAHQGAPLERVGHGSTCRSAPPICSALARLGKVRSAGINDLRLGNSLAAPCGDGGTQRCDPVGLPNSTRCFAVAASLGPPSPNLKSRLLGDGLVPVASALGQHHDHDRRLAFAADRQAVVHDTNHLELLSSAKVHELLRQWLG